MITEYDADAFLRLLFGWGENIERVGARIGPRRTSVFYKGVDQVVTNKKGWTLKATIDTKPIVRWRETGDTSFIDDARRLAGARPL